MQTERQTLYADGCEVSATNCDYPATDQRSKKLFGQGSFMGFRYPEGTERGPKI